MVARWRDVVKVCYTNVYNISSLNTMITYSTIWPRLTGDTRKYLFQMTVDESNSARVLW